MTTLDDQNTRTSWWSRPCGPRTVLALALPLVVSTLSYALMQFFDRLFLTRYCIAIHGIADAPEVAAVLPAGVLGWTAFSFPLGLAGYATTFVAQYYGAGQFKRIGRVIWQAFRIGLLCIPLYYCLGFVGPYLFRLFGHAEQIVELESTYFGILTLGFGTAVMAEALTSYFVGTGRAMPVMAINVAASLLNIVLDYLMIFGIGIFPEMGIAGAGWATTISVWFKCAAFLLLILTCRNRVAHGIVSEYRFDGALTKQLIRFGAPHGFHFMLEGGAITLFVLFLAGISEQASASAAIAFSVNMVAFVPIVGLGMAVTTLVGQEIGNKRSDLAARASISGLGIALVYSLGFAFCYLFLPDLFLAPYQSDVEKTPQLIGEVRILLRFVAAYCVFDAIQLVFISVCKGAGDTLFILGTTICSTTSFVLFGWLVSRFFTSESGQVFVWWSAITAWIFALSVVYSFRFLQGKWKTMTVIEPELVEIPKSVPNPEQPDDDKVVA